MFGTSAFAQEAQRKAPATEETNVDEVVVTATRLTAAGFDAPTPTQILGEEQLNQAAHPNIFETVEQLPALMGSRSSRVGNGGTSEGINGLSVFSTRGLGPIRTLTLIDGQRVAGANQNGVVDVSLMPQLLIQRVDVVTGGASASYGSDAVGGVVNFVTNRAFEGFKANIAGGMTNYEDGKNLLAQVAVGRAFLDDRFRIAVSGEYYDNKGIPAREPGVNGGPNGRDWFALPQVATRTIAQTPAGDSQYRLIVPAQFNTFAAYGLITAGPLRGTAFGAGGQPYQFQYGTDCIGVYCLGGENTGNVLITNAWDGELRRKVGYTRMSYNITDNVEAYATLSYGHVRSSNQTNAGARREANLTIQCSNPYLPAATVAACAANNITSFQYGVSNIIFPADVTVETNRKQPRFVVGLNASDVSVFGKPWNIQTYYEHGETNIAIDIHNVTLIPRYLAAIDAVRLPSGEIACRNVTARAAGCVPFNIIGDVPVNPAAWNYIAPENGPRVRTFQRQEAFSFAMSGVPFQNWAGDVALAFGVEAREEFYKQRADWFGAGLSTLSTVTPEHPADPVLVATGNNWYAGSFKNGSGRYDVKDAFAEVGMPLFDNGAGKLDFNIAGRVTDYSTSGTVTTWKIGGVWQTPLEGLRIRTVRSRDVRAPNLSELFAAPISQNATVLDRTRNNAAVNVDQRIIGNSGLVPEESDNWQLGAVFRPTFLSGFSGSIDYYSVKINKAIAALTGQQIVDLCQISSNSAACANINLAGQVGTANPPFVIIQPFNLSSIETRGIDFEAGYKFNLDAVGLPGSFDLRAMVTHVLEFTSDTGIPGQPIVKAAGNNSNLGGGYTNGDFGITPKWKGLVTQTWTWDKLSLSVTERFVSKGYINPEWVECKPGSCPVATLQHPTIDDNTLPGAVYFDIGGQYEFAKGAEAYFKVDNLFEKNPPPYGHTSVYDWFGRVYRVGIRYQR